MTERAAPAPYTSWQEYWDAFFQINPAQRVKRDLVVAYAASASPDVRQFLEMRYGSYFGRQRDASMKRCAATLGVPEERLLAMQKTMLRDVWPRLMASPEFREDIQKDRPVRSPLSTPPSPPSSSGG